MPDRPRPSAATAILHPDAPSRARGAPVGFRSRVALRVAFLGGGMHQKCIPRCIPLRRNGVDAPVRRRIVTIGNSYRPVSCRNDPNRLDTVGAP
jgi:hypothetical protein